MFFNDLSIKGKIYLAQLDTASVPFREQAAIARTLLIEKIKSQFNRENKIILKDEKKSK